MGPLAETLARSPELFPFGLDLGRDTVTLLRLSRADYEQASFLDRRIAAHPRPGRTLPFAELAQAVEDAALREDCHFIFHIGHVGSTLLSRLMGRHPALFSLREPDILRTLATTPGTRPAETHLPVFLKLWSRTFDPGARAIVKTTSFVSSIAPELLARPYAPRALAMAVAPETYLATILGGANAPAEARALAPLRLARLERRLGCHIEMGGFGIGEWVALGWACEATSLAAAKAAGGDRVLIFDFERFLADPEHELTRALAHFDIEIDTDTVRHILAGPEMRTYSKAPEHPYDTRLRSTVLGQGRREHAAEIYRGLDWLKRIARDQPQIRSATESFN